MNAIAIKDKEHIVFSKGGSAFCNSIGVAAHFGKRHADVLRSVEALTRQASEAPDSKDWLTERNFTLSEYVDPTGRKLPVYEMDRDGFTLLAMGFTGKEALHWKIQYIRAFNAMEAELRKPSKEIAGIRGAVLHYVKEHVAVPLLNLQKYLDDRFTAVRERDKMLLGSNAKLADEVRTLKADVGTILTFARRSLAPEAFIRPEWCDLTDIYRMAGYEVIPQRGLLSARVSRQLDAFCKTTGRQVDMRIWRHAGKNSSYWRKPAVEAWLSIAGSSIIRQHVDRPQELAKAG